MSGRPSAQEKRNGTLMPAPDADAAELNRQGALARAEARAEERQRELDMIRHQQAIDAAWQRTLAAEAEAEAEAGFHRGRGD